MQRKPTDIFRTRLIGLNSDRAVQAGLWQKLQEYHQRLSTTSPHVEPDPTYKWYVLNELLTKGCIDVLAIESAFARHCEWHRSATFWNAVAVITAYNTGQTEGMHQAPMNT